MEEIRIRTVQRVQDSENTEVVIKTIVKITRFFSTVFLTSGLPPALAQTRKHGSPFLRSSKFFSKFLCPFPSDRPRLPAGHPDYSFFQGSRLSPGGRSSLSGWRCQIQFSIPGSSTSRHFSLQGRSVKAPGSMSHQIRTLFCASVWRRPGSSGKVEKKCSLQFSWLFVSIQFNCIQANYNLIFSVSNLIFSKADLIENLFNTTWRE